MVELFESIMLCAFGCSWPINAYKSWKSQSAEGKSILFSIIILIGYIAGITGKIVSGTITYVFLLYIINIAFVTLDLVLTLNNKYHFAGKQSAVPVEPAVQEIT
ncbi:MAG: hypothetical protein LKF96_05535 [Treponema sp.]|jgi:hypothetical protein|nr:hypothetical protein [Treponema sp.]